jgi:MFS family permease
MTILSLILFGGSQGIAMTPVLPAMARYVADHGSSDYATVYGIFNLAYSVAMLFGPPMAGYLLASVGFFWMMISFSIALVVLFLLLVIIGLDDF